MAAVLLPGVGYADDSASALLPGGGYLVSSGSTSSVTADYVGSYSVIGTVSADLAATYDIEGAGSVLSDFTATYSVIGTASADLVAAFSLIGSLTKDLTATFNILGNAGVQLNVNPDHVLKNNTGTIWASEEFKLTFYRADTDAFVVNKTVTTDVNGLLGTVSDAALVAGVAYDIKIKRTANLADMGLFNAEAV